MIYFITDRSGRIHKFGNWSNAVRFAIQQAKLNPQIPVNMSSGLTHYQVWANGEIDRVETYCACDTCRLCDSPNGSATCPHYWEHHGWEYYATFEE